MALIHRILHPALAQPAPRLAARGLAAAWAHWGWGGGLAAPPHAE